MLPSTHSRQQWPAYRKLAHNTLLPACWTAVFLPVLVWLLIRSIGEDWWVATVLLYGPLWVLMLPNLLLLPFAVWRRQRVGWWLVASIVFTSGPLLGLELNIPIPQASPSQARKPFKLISCNVGGGALDWNNLIPQVAKEQPDAVLLQECPDAAKAAAAFPPIDWHVHAAGGLFLASRFPIVERATIVNAEGWRTMAAFSRLQLPGGSIWVVNIHLDTPRRGFEELRHGNLSAAIHTLEQDADTRGNESRQVRQRVDALHEWAIVAGDFNLVPNSLIYRENWGHYADAFDVAGFGYGSTKQTRLWGVRIDHVLVQSAGDVQACHIGADVGSDHRPLIVELSIPLK